MRHSGPELARRKVRTPKGEAYDASVIRCETCGYAHLHPIPSLEELGQFYAYHFYEKQKPDYLEKMEREADYWLEIYRWRFGTFKRYMKDSSPYVLDVGSSGGFFLEAARRQGANVLGIEPSQKAADFAREKFGVEAVVDLYEKARLPRAQFNLIHSSLVMEHLREPVHFVRWAYDHLEEEGLFVAEVPHEFNRYQDFLVSKKGYEPWFVAYPDHINYFTQSSLQSLVEDQGFEQVKVFCSFPMEQFVLQGLDYLSEPDAGLRAHQARMAFETNLLKNGGDEIMDSVSSSWARDGIGRTQIQVFRKRS